MGDIDIVGNEQVVMGEQISQLYEMLFASVYDASAAAESIGRMMEIYAVPDAQGVTVADVVSSVPVRNLEFFKGMKTASIGMLLTDWSIENNYTIPNKGINLKGMVLKGGSGGSDVMVVKDGSDTGPYLYNATVATSVVLVYPGTLCKPYIDYSECTLTTGHMFTFLWE